MASIEADWIDMVLARATELRKAGVLIIGCDGHTAQFAPWVAPIEKPIGKATDENEPQLDPLDEVLRTQYPGSTVGYVVERFEPEDP